MSCVVFLGMEGLEGSEAGGWGCGRGEGMGQNSSCELHYDATGI